MKTDPKQIPPPGFVAAEPTHKCNHCHRLFHGYAAYWGHKCGTEQKGEGGVMPAISDHGVTELVQSAPQPPEQGEAEPKSLQAAAAKAIDAMRTTQRLCNLPDGHLLASAERALDAALRAIEDAEQSSNPLQLPPHQSAAEWVWEHIVHVCDDGGTERMITEDDALELACRCDEAKVYLRVQAHKTDALRAQLAAAQADAASWKSHAEKLQTAIDRAHQAAEVHQADYLQRISAVKEELATARDMEAAARIEADAIRATQDQVIEAATKTENELARLRKGITEIKAGTRIGWFMTDLGAKCEKLLNP